GMDLLAEVRQRQPDTACIIVTGRANLQTAIEALNRGAYAYIVKPIDVAEIRATFQRAVEKQRLERENRRLLTELAALSEVTDAALSTLELDDLLQELVASLTQNAGAAAGALVLGDQRARITHLQTHG